MPNPYIFKTRALGPNAKNSPLTFKNLSGRYSSFIDPIAVGEIGEYFDHWISKKSKQIGFSKHRKFRGKV